MRVGTGTGAGTGTVDKKIWEPEPEPRQNGTVPQHWSEVGRLKETGNEKGSDLSLPFITIIPHRGSYEQ